MRSFAVALCLTLLTGTAYAADEIAACRARHAELSTKAATFTGEPTIKRLIQADLDRATREMLEGDSDECAEALDHAAKLLAGDV